MPRKLELGSPKGPLGVTLGRAASLWTMGVTLAGALVVGTAGGRGAAVRLRKKLECVPGQNGRRTARKLLAAAAAVWSCRSPHYAGGSAQGRPTRTFSRARQRRIFPATICPPNLHMSPAATAATPLRARWRPGATAPAAAHHSPSRRSRVALRLRRASSAPPLPQPTTASPRPRPQRLCNLRQPSHRRPSSRSGRPPCSSSATRSRWPRAALRRGRGDAGARAPVGCPHRPLLRLATRPDRMPEAGARARSV